MLMALAGCHFQTDPPDHAPAGVTASPGDGLAVIGFDQEPNLTYWIFYQPGSAVVAAAQGATILRDAISPHVVSGLTNGTQYAFVMNSTSDDSSAGPSSSVVLATPRLAGENWVVGAAIGAMPQNLNGLASSGARFVAVGNAATVLAGDFKYTSASPPGVTEWLPPASFPAGFASNLVAVTYSTQFVALSAEGAILTSADGLTWTLSTSTIPSTGMNNLAFGFPLYVAVGNGGKIFTSTDLVTWNEPVSNTLDDLYGVSLLNGRFVVTGANGALLTGDGVNWTVQTSNTGNALRGAAFSATPTALYVAVGDAGTVVTSADGITWNPIAQPLAQNARSVVFGSRFMTVGQGGGVAYSDDGLNWTQTSAGASDLARVLFAPGMYIAVGAAGANVVSR